MVRIHSWIPGICTALICLGVMLMWFAFLFGVVFEAGGLILVSSGLVIFFLFDEDALDDRLEKQDAG